MTPTQKRQLATDALAVLGAATLAVTCASTAFLAGLAAVRHLHRRSL